MNSAELVSSYLLSWSCSNNSVLLVNWTITTSYLSISIYQLNNGAHWVRREHRWSVNCLNEAGIEIMFSVNYYDYRYVCIAMFLHLRVEIHVTHRKDFGLKKIHSRKLRIFLSHQCINFYESIRLNGCATKACNHVKDVWVKTLRAGVCTLWSKRFWRI